MARKVKADADKVTGETVSVRFSDELLTKIDASAKATGLARAQVVRLLVHRSEPISGQGDVTFDEVRVALGTASGGAVATVSSGLEDGGAD